jgi:hypothetical protein
MLKSVTIAFCELAQSCKLLRNHSISGANKEKAMVRLTKQQRRERRKRKRLESKKRGAATPRQTPWVAPKMKFFEMPRLLPDDLPMEKRLGILRRIGIQAKERFDLKYPQIAAWFRDYDPLYLLSFCATYFVSQPEGVDPEVSEKLVFYHHYIEIMQAFALAQERALTVKPLLEDASRLEQDMHDIGEAMSLRLLNIPQELTAGDELNAYHLRSEMMAQTTAIRNWAYPHQMKRVVFSLATSIKDAFKSIYGMDPVDLVQLIFDLTEEREDLLNAHIDKIRTCFNASNYRAIIEAYNAAFPENVRIEGAAIEEIWTRAGKKKRNLVGMLATHADLKLDRIYSFTLEHAQSLLDAKVPDDVLERLLDRLSYQFGDLEDFNKEYIILGNPVLSRPFIRFAERSYFSAIWGIMPHIALGVMEDLVWANESMRNVYTAAKADYLELEVERLCRTAFPNASVHRGSLWTDKQTGKDYENDLTVVLDNFALVVEAKSGVVSDPAKRGAPKRLFETLRELIEEPSEQALNFIHHLERNQEEHSFKTKHTAINLIDSRRIKYYIPLGVTFSNLGLIGSNLKKLIRAKVVNKQLEELAPSISLTDLEVIFEILPLEVQKVHYLARRREFEAHMEYEGDELDLLGFYLDNGFNIGNKEYTRDLVINMTLKSKELDPYFAGTSEGKRVVQPELAMTKWWKDLLRVISDRKMDGWVETGFILLNSTKEDQTKFERMFRELMLRIRKGKVDKLHNWVMFASGPERRRYLIAGYPYTTTEKDVRNGVMGQIISDENFGAARGCVVIGVQMERLDYPYSVLARRASTNLFDTLTLQ